MRAILTVFTLACLLCGCGRQGDADQVICRIKRDFDSGNFSALFRVADSLQRVSGDLNVRNYSDSLRQIAERIMLDFSVTEDQLRAMLQENSLSVSPYDIEYWENKGWLECRFIDGQKMYFRRTLSNLILLRKFENREEWLKENSTDPELVFRLINTADIVRQNKIGVPVIPVKVKVSYTITVHPDVVPEGKTIRCWMPYPKESHPRQTGVRLLSASEKLYSIAPDSAVHRSIYMEKAAQKGAPAIFTIAFEYISYGQQFDSRLIRAGNYDTSSVVFKEFTSEQPPQITFSPQVKHLADSIVKNEKDPREITRKIYFWFKENIVWTGALEYSTMADIPGYVCKNLRGDCGMQTLLFMSLLRYKEIPVRWQSGWMMPVVGTNLHDWCEIWYEGTGWVPVDVTYNLQQSDDQKIKEFFISGIDSYRMIVNDGIAGQLYPPKRFLRSEPYDFQRGEVEWEGGNLYFDKWDYDIDIEYAD